MKRPPETIEILLSLLTETTNIRDRELLYHTLPEEEQTPAAKEALRRDLERQVLRLSERYGAQLERTPEGVYLERLRTEYSLGPKSIDDFIDMYKLSTRTANIIFNLEQYGSKKVGIPKIKKPEDLRNYDANQLLKVKGFGRKSLLELDAAFQQEGWEIKGIEKYREMERKRLQKYK